MIEVKGHNFMSPQLRSMPVEWLASNSELSGKVAPQVLGTTNIAVQDPLAMGVAGRSWKIPFMKRDTRGMLPSCKPSTGSCICEIHALYTPTVL
jgi:hypothetical protein